MAGATAVGIEQEAAPAPRHVRWHRLPVVHQLRQSVGL